MRIDMRVRINQGQLLEFIKQPLVQLFAHGSVLKKHLDVTASRSDDGSHHRRTVTQKKTAAIGTVAAVAEQLISSQDSRPEKRFTD